MNPLEQKVQELERRLAALEGVQNVSFIGSLERRIGAGVVEKGTSVNTSLLRGVNEGGVATYNVAKAPDLKLEVRLSDGTTKFIGVYNS